MYRRRILAITLVTLFLPVSVALAQAAPGDPLALVQQYVAAINRGDAAAATAVFTEDGTWQGKGVCSAYPNSTCVGRAVLQQQFAQTVSDHKHYISVTPVGAPPAPDTVVVKVQVTDVAGNIHAAGVDRVVNIWTVQARGGKISSLVAKPDTSDPQTVKWQAYLQAHPAAPIQAPAQMPRTGAGGTGTGVWGKLVLLGLLLSGLGGLCLVTRRI
jgi:ketosteroid isomerase-like protein